MAPTVVLFEDHSLKNFRPLAAGQPVYELRLGMFNLRERVELAGGKGTLLSRKILEPLHTCPDWALNSAALGASRSVLWLNARCRFSVAELKDLFAALDDSGPFSVHDDQGMLAAWSDEAQSSSLLNSWHNWAQEQAAKDIPATWTGLPEAGQAPAGVPALRFLFDLVPATRKALENDAALLQSGATWTRHPFGIFSSDDSATPFWALDSVIQPAEDHPTFRGRFPEVGQGIFLGENTSVAPGVVVDAGAGPVIVDRDVKIMPFCYLAGPLYVGPGTRVKAGSAIYGESSFGIGNRLSGEIGESTFGDFANKQHDGFIGHAVIGSWTNLGAMTTCSDLKNNYGNVRVDLGFGAIDSGRRFVGLMLGDHAKTAIGTLFNTGTCVGFASNIFGEGMPPKYVPAFSWGGRVTSPAYGLDQAVATAEVVFARRGCRMLGAHKKMMEFLSAE